ncbi:MAG: MCE family protein [Actinomycetota bacterium]
MRAAAFKLALFTVFTVVVTTWLAAVIGNMSLFSDSYQISAEFTDATGLLRGDPVKAAGVTVGNVLEIEIDEGLALVTMEIGDETRLPSGLSAAIRYRNLIGQRMVTLVQGEDSQVALASQEYIPSGHRIPFTETEPAFDLTVLFDDLRPLIRSTSAEDINVVTKSLTRALRGRSDEVENLLGNIGEVSTAVAERDRQLTVLLDNVNIVAEDLNGRDVQLQATLADMRSFVADLAASRNDLDTALVTLDDAATRLRRVVAGNRADLAAEIDDLSSVLDAVESRRDALRAAVRQLPEFLEGVERTNNYGQWTNVVVVNICKDDLGVCGRRPAQ